MYKVIVDRVNWLIFFKKLDKKIQKLIFYFNA